MKYLSLFLALLILPLITSCAAQVQQDIQADVGKLQADLQAKKASLVPQLQAGIAYADSKGDVIWSTCQKTLLTWAQSPAADIGDIANPFIAVENIYQVGQNVQNVGSSAFVTDLRLGCGPWYLRVKDESLAIAAKIGVLIK